MAQDNSQQIPWTDEQWARVRQVIQEEASRARVAATFLPLYGPLSGDTDFVRADRISYKLPNGDPRMVIDDTTVLQIPTLQVKVYVRGAQMSDPDMTSVLALFRRAANVLARLEDALVFNGQPAASEGPPTVDGLPPVWEILGGQKSRGLLAKAAGEGNDEALIARIPGGGLGALGELLVGKISQAIGTLESGGHFGPFAVVLGQELFQAVQTPNRDSLVLPQDRILPFLGSGGSLNRSTTLPPRGGVVVALGGAPVELVVATDVSLNFLQVSPDPRFVFRVYEKVVLRIKESGAIVSLMADETPAARGSGGSPAGANSTPSRAR
jgi:uncharacterized linocin/CFP29 family protein